jgi:hypothetical protein
MARKAKPKTRRAVDDDECPDPVGNSIGIPLGEMLGIPITIDLAAAGPMITILSKLHALEKDLRAGGLLDYADRLKAAITEWEMTK